jgi:hypothetical protein
MLDSSVGFGNKRYATDGDAVFCSQCHNADTDTWHGYPVAWSEVDPKVRTTLIEDGRVTSRHVRRSLRTKS